LKRMLPDVTGHHSFMRKIDGWLVAAKDVNEWAKAIAFLAQNPSTIAQLKQNIQPVKTRARVATEMLELYQSLMREY
jgi:glycosyltransferase involved in cell wall biosynthesis